MFYHRISRWHRSQKEFKRCKLCHITCCFRRAPNSKSCDYQTDNHVIIREWAEVGTPGLCFLMACDLWSFEAIHETVSSVYAHLNSVIILIVNYLVIYKNCQKFGWYYVLDLLIHFHWAFFRACCWAEDTGTELKPFTLQGWLILIRTWIKLLLDLTCLYP